MRRNVGMIERWCLLLVLPAVTLQSPSWLAQCGRLCAQEQEGKKQASARDFNVAAALQNSGFYERAAEKWAAFLKAYPQDKRLDQVHYYLGICRLQNKQFAEAKQSFQTVLSKYADFKQRDGAMYNLGMADYQLAQSAAAENKPADFPLAAQQLAAVAEKFPQSKYAPMALYYQADASYLAGDANKAIEIYQQLIGKFADHPLVPHAYYYLGVTQQDQELDEAAAETFEAFLGKPEHEKHELAGEIRLRLGLARFSLEQYEQAEAHFRQVAALPEYPLADLALIRAAQCRLELGKPAEAAAQLQQVIKNYPQSRYLAEAQLSLGKSFYAGEKFAEAQQVLEPLAGKDLAESPEAAYYLGRTLLRMNRAQDALARLDNAVKSFSEGEFAPFLKAARIDALFELPERREETPELYADFVEQHPEHPLKAQSLYMAAFAALDQKDYEAARQHAETFLQDAKLAEHTLLPSVLYVAAEGYLLPTSTAEKPLEAAVEQQQLAQAEQLYRRLIADYAEHSDAPQAHLRIGWCLVESDKAEQAAAFLGESLAKLAQPQHKAEAHLLLGHALAEQEQHPQAVAAFEAALKAKADWERNDEVLLAAGASLRALEKHDEAKARLQQLVSQHPESRLVAQAYSQLGQIAQVQEQHDAAIGHYRNLLAKFPQHPLVPAAHYGLGAAFFAKEDYTAAIDALNAAAAAEDDTPLVRESLYLRGLARQRMEQFEPAVQDFQAFLALEPEADAALDARYNLALSRVGLEQHEQAATELAALLEEKPDYQFADRVHYELAHARDALDKAAEAAASFRTLATKFPESPLAGESWFRVGNYHVEVAEGLEDEQKQQPQFAQAAEAYQAGLQVAKADGLREKLLYKLGDMQLRQQQYEPASKTLLEQLAKYPDRELAPHGRYLAAESMFYQNAFDKALPLFVAVAQDKDAKEYTARALYRAGRCAAELKQWPESQKYYAQLLDQFKEFPQTSEARYGLGRSLQMQNKGEQAVPLLELVTKETETDTAAKARFLIGEIAFAQEQYEEAIVHFIAVTVGYPYKPWQARAKLEAARCFNELEKTERAATLLNELIEEHPERPETEDAKKLLAELAKKKS